jgi:hypothetical protein
MSDWERVPDGAKARQGYDSGWDYVLDLHVIHSR